VAAKNLRDLLLDEAKRCGVALEDLFLSAVDAIRSGELKSDFQSQHYAPMSEERRHQWMRGGQDWTRRNRDASITGNGVNTWVRDIIVDARDFDRWFEQKHGSSRPVRKPNHNKMRRAYEDLLWEGREFTSQKAAYGAVMKRLGISGKKDGYSRYTFSRATEGLPRERGLK
jgi:hypothetical protein